MLSDKQIKLKISELAKRARVSVRTLHHYDKIGLLKAASVSEAGYRYYDQASIEKLELILYFRELDFPLSEIARIIKDPKLDRSEILKDQYQLLSLKRDRLNRLLKQLDNSIKGGVMSLEEFDMSEIEEAQEKYGKEAEERWGHTDAYKESARRTSRYTRDDWARISAEQEVIYSGFAQMAADKADPSSEEAKALAKAWQKSISDNFYPCSDEILAGLGQMYIADARFTENIDKHGEGTAAFMSAAIDAYVG